jgi:hypothetical protein
MQGNPKNPVAEFRNDPHFSQARLGSAGMDRFNKASQCLKELLSQRNDERDQYQASIAVIGSLVEKLDAYIRDPEIRASGITLTQLMEWMEQTTGYSYDPSNTRPVEGASPAERYKPMAAVNAMAHLVTLFTAELAIQDDKKQEYQRIYSGIWEDYKKRSLFLRREAADSSASPGDLVLRDHAKQAVWVAALAKKLGDIGNKEHGELAMRAFFGEGYAPQAPLRRVLEDYLKDIVPPHRPGKTVSAATMTHIRDALKEEAGHFGLALGGAELE